MAGTTRATTEDPIERQLFAFDGTLTNDPVAQRAQRAGVLQAKQEALQSARTLAKIGRPLLVGVLVVSFLHLWHQISLIRPADVPALELPPWAHHVSAALQTVAIDLVAFYLVATRSTAFYAGSRRPLWGRWFFFILTGLLNALFVLRYTPVEIMPQEVSIVLPFLGLISAVMIALMVPVAIAAVEGAHHVADAARLALVVETETLKGMVAHDTEVVAQEKADAAHRRKIEDERQAMERQRQIAELEQLRHALTLPAPAPAIEPAAPLVAEPVAQPVVWTLDGLLREAGVKSRDELRSLAARANVTTPHRAYDLLQTWGRLPDGLDEVTFARLWHELHEDAAAEEPVALGPFDAAELLRIIDADSTATAAMFFGNATPPRAYQQVRKLAGDAWGRRVGLAEFTPVYDALMRESREDDPVAADGRPVFVASPARYETFQAVLDALSDLPTLATGELARRIGKSERSAYDARQELVSRGVLVVDGKEFRLGEVQLVKRESAA